MTKRRDNSEGFDYVCDVIGIQTGHRLLQVGNDDLPFMRKYVTEEQSYVARTRKELRKNYRGEEFERIIVRGIDVDEDLLSRLFEQCTGLITVFVEDDEDRNELAEWIDTTYYPCDVWHVEMNLGKAIMTDAKGYPTMQSRKASIADLENFKRSF